MDKISLFPCNIEANENPSTIISLASFGKLNIFNKMWFQEVYIMKMKISNFFKILFFVLHLHLLMIIHWILMISKIFEVLDFVDLCWPLLAFAGLHWPLRPWMNFLSKNWPFLVKIKHNWPVCNNQMSKLISKWDRAF